MLNSILYKKFSKKEIIIVLCSIFILLSFIFFQFYKIYNSGIGTDEGNFLFITKLIQQNKIIFFDFYSRESGPLLILTPFFKIFNISIINLRYLIFGIHLLTLYFLYNCLSQISKNKPKNLLIVAISSVVLSFGGPLEIYTGIFYQLQAFLSVLLIFLLLKYWFNNNFFSKKYLIWLGLLTGLGIITYKGLQIFWVLIPFTIYLKQSSWKYYVKSIVLFFLTSIFPVLFYGFYYAYWTNIMRIYNIILSDVFLNFIILFGIFLIGATTFKIIKQEDNLTNNKEIWLILLNFIFIIGLTYNIMKDATLFFSSFYGGLILQYSFLIIMLQYLTISQTYRYRRPLIFSYILTNLTIAVLGFGSRGFFTDVPITYHILSTGLFIFYNLILISIFIYPSTINKIYKNSNLLYICLILNIYFIITGLFGGYIMPTRFSSLLYFLPILILSTSLIYSQKIIRVLIFITLILSACFSIFINIKLPNDYTFYSKESFEYVVNYIKDNIKTDKSVFSGDTALLSEIENKSIINFYSPWQFIDNQKENCLSGESYEFITKDVCLGPKEILEQIKLRNPDYIIGSWRSTLRTFENLEGESFLEQNYILEIINDRIYIFKKKI